MVRRAKESAGRKTWPWRRFAGVVFMNRKLRPSESVEKCGGLGVGLRPEVERTGVGHTRGVFFVASFGGKN